MDPALEGLFMEAASRAGGIEDLLDAFFGFLHARTDFYRVIPEEGARVEVGFPSGKAERMVS